MNERWVAEIDKEPLQNRSPCDLGAPCIYLHINVSVFRSFPPSEFKELHSLPHIISSHRPLRLIRKGCAIMPWGCDTNQIIIGLPANLGRWVGCGGPMRADELTTTSGRAWGRNRSRRVQPPLHLTSLRIGNQPVRRLLIGFALLCLLISICGLFSPRV